MSDVIRVNDSLSVWLTGELRGVGIDREGGGFVLVDYGEVPALVDVLEVALDSGKAGAERRSAWIATRLGALYDQMSDGGELNLCQVYWAPALVLFDVCEALAIAPDSVMPAEVVALIRLLQQDRACPVPELQFHGPPGCTLPDCSKCVVTAEECASDLFPAVEE
jgi:hypothetical protein